jgi:hypothetical protein
MDWARILAYVTGTVDQELLARNAYLAAENRILKAQLNGRPRLSDADRGVLGEIGHRLGRKGLADIATVARPDTILGWHRKLSGQSGHRENKRRSFQVSVNMSKNGGPGEIRTHDLCLRRAALYPAELRVQRGGP